MLSSNLRPTTRECVLLITRDHFQSRYKDGGHTIQSAIAENPMLHANFVALCFVELELLPIKVLHCGNINFRPFCFCDLDLNPMTFIYELDLYSLELYHMCIVKAFESYHLTDRQTDRQTQLKLYTMPLHRWSVAVTNYVATVVKTSDDDWLI